LTLAAASATNNGDASGSFAGRPRACFPKGKPGAFHRSASLSKRQPSSPAGLRILVVEDEKDSADSLAMLLRIWGHHVEVAYRATDALHLTRTYTPDVALLNLTLSPLEIDGYQLAQTLRAREELDQMVLLAVTGWGDDEHRRRSHEVGFALHLVKPIDLIFLEKLLSEFAAKKLAEARPEEMPGAERITRPAARRLNLRGGRKHLCRAAAGHLRRADKVAAAQVLAAIEDCLRVARRLRRVVRHTARDE